MRTSERRSLVPLSPRGWAIPLVFLAVALVTAVFSRGGLSNSTTVALTYLTVILFAAATLPLWVAVTASLVAMLCFNFFFLPPVGTLTIADPHNWVALAAFLLVSLVASHLSSTVRAREREALERRDAMARLFDLGRDILIMTGGRQALTALAQVVARRFELDYVGICTPTDDGWDIADAGSVPAPLPDDVLNEAYARASRRIEFDASERAYIGHQPITVGGAVVQLVPLRAGAVAVGLLAASGRPVEPGTLDALGGLVAIAMERATLLEERRAAEFAHQREELQSALLASLGHDLRTPLTAIRVAASNLQGTLPDEDRREQAALVLSEVERLTRLFQNILEMARIDAGAVTAEQRWVHAGELIEVARELVAPALAGHAVHVTGDTSALVRLDPRLTASALSHLLENAAQYSPAGADIDIAVGIGPADLTLAVADRGPGLAPAEHAHVFDRFYRGQAGKPREGTGMGLSIARGLLAAEGGRVWADNRPGGGAVFTIAVPAEWRQASMSAADLQPPTEAMP
ncbi:MAG: DUF4118 domain-containing protein [Acidobacteria bacterium]|nr:DUF4118 domain-containing protein [Acidobacteriota bacterium]